jgi:hypothetical protein
LIDFLSLYAKENPFWLLTIPFAILSRISRRAIAQDRIDTLFFFLLILILLFPILSVMIFGGSSDMLDTAFLAPLYQMTGMLSIAMLVRREIFRSLTPSKAMYYSIAGLVIVGVVVSLISHWESHEFILFAILLAVFFSAAAHHAGVRIGKRDMPHEVQEADRSRFTYSSDGADHYHTLSEVSTHALRGMLMIALAWPIASLAGDAKDFAESIRTENTTEVAMARAIASVTPPEDAVASNEIGAIGYFAERRVVDLSGQLSALRDGDAVAH